MAEGNPKDHGHEEEIGRIRLGPGVSVHRDSIGWRFSRSSGPGGQNVNKVNTKAELRLRIDQIEGLNEAARARLRTLAGSRLTDDDELLMTADETRSQRRNREAALSRLADLVRRAAIAPKVRRKRRPSRAAIERRLERKRRRADKKQRRSWRPGRE